MFENNKVFKTTNYVPTDEKKCRCTDIYGVKNNKVKNYNESDARRCR